jgi:hypothetical protein
MASSIGGSTAGAIGQSTSLLGTLAGGGVFGGGAQGLMTGGTGTAPLLNPGGGFQPNDINTAPYVGSDGTVSAGAPGSAGTAPAPADSGGGAGAMSMAGQALGIGMAAYSTGTTWANNFNSGNTGQMFMGDIMSGAALGTAIMPGIGTAVGALAGLEMAVISDIFGDHGASKARQYNEAQVKPAIVREMTSYTAAQVGFDQGLQDMEMLQLKAQAQTKQWGSGSVGVYNRTIAPEINVAIAEMQRQQNADRSGAIGMEAAQYDSGGVVRHFGDLSTGPNSGFIHAQVGERMLDRMTNMRHSSTLDAMSRGADISRGNGAGLSGGGGSGGGGEVHLHIETMDAQSFDYFLRNGGAQRIQAAVNANAGRYAGKALSA